MATNYKDGPDAVAQYIRDNHDLSENGENIHGFIYFDTNRDIVFSEVVGDLSKIIVSEDAMDELMHDLDNTALLYDAVAVGIFVRHHDPEDHDAYACQAEVVLLDAIDDLTDRLKGIFAMGLSTQTDEYDLKFSTADTLKFLKAQFSGGPVGDLLDKLGLGDRVADSQRRLLAEAMPEGVDPSIVSPEVHERVARESEKQLNYIFDKSESPEEQARRFAAMQRDAVRDMIKGLEHHGFSTRDEWPPAMRVCIEDMETLIEETEASGAVPTDERLRESLPLQKAALTERLTMLAKEKGILPDDGVTSRPSTPAINLGNALDQMRRRVPAPSSLFDLPALDLLGSPFTDDKPQ